MSLPTFKTVRAIFGYALDRISGEELQNRLVSANEITHHDTQFGHFQLANMRADPIVLIPAPGEGFAINALFGWIHFSFPNRVFYTDNGGAPKGNFYIGEQQITSGNPFANFLSGVSVTAPATKISDTFSTINNTEDLPGTPAFEADNLPFTFRNDGDVEYAGGDPANTFSLRTFYSIVPTVPFGS